MMADCELQSMTDARTGGETRHILHVDMDAFFAAVEQRDNPELRGKPILIGGSGPRAVVSTASYEARPFGCHSAQPMAEARRLCPQAIVIKPRGDAYRTVSQQVFAIFEHYSPLVQPLSVDEAFIDVTGSMRLFGSAEVIAQQIRQRIRDELQLTASVGVAPNKFIAKLASDQNKPDGLTVVEAQHANTWLSAQPIERMWGVGPAAMLTMNRYGIRTFGDLLHLPDSTLKSQLGTWGLRIKQLAAGIDDRAVVPDREARSISHEQTFARDVDDADYVRSVLLEQVEQVAWRVRKHHVHTRTLSIKIRYGMFETISRSTTLDEPTDRTDVMWQAVRALYDAWVQRSFQPVRLIGAAARVVRSGEQQLGLFDAPQAAHAQQIDQTLDAIVERFGKRSIHRAAALRRQQHDSDTK